LTRLPSLKPIDVIHKLRKAGFVFDRHAKGSHEIWYNPVTRRRTVVPNHPNHDLAKGTLRAIICQSGLSSEEFNKL
jgi:predicted RNA binding protein YcfA (HicA-like mRNA interferase family)